MCAHASEKAARTRISVTLTKIYVDGLNYLLDEGLYLNRGDIFLAALRILFTKHGLEPFTKKEQPEED